MLGQIGLIEEILRATDFNDMQVRLKRELLHALEAHHATLRIADTQPEVRQDIERKILRLRSLG